MTRTSLILALAVAGGAAIAQDARELDAHEHGVGLLNLAFEGDQVAIDLEAPGMDLVGFEYEATSAEDLALIDAAIARLADPLTLFVLPAAAGCLVTEANAGLVEEEGEHAEGEMAAGEAAEEEDGEHHTEFQAQYLLTCADPAAIDGIDFAYFEAFPNAAELEVQMISGAGTQGFEVMREAPRLDLAGLI